MLSGLDLSHHNLNMKNRNDINKYDFIILKATEGRTYKDKSVSTWLNVLDKNKLKGFYHFARPENGNSPEAEAENFLNYIGKYIDGKSLLALDVEAGALRYKDLDNWVNKWVKYVKEKTGVMPLIYCSEAETKRFKKVCEYGCGLWCAKWGNNFPKSVNPWKLVAIWQKTDSFIVSSVRCDFDQFNGTREQYIKYCEVKYDKENNSNTPTSEKPISKRGTRKAKSDK